MNHPQRQRLNHHQQLKGATEVLCNQGVLTACCDDIVQNARTNRFHDVQKIYIMIDHGATSGSG